MINRCVNNIFQSIGHTQKLIQKEALVRSFAYTLFHRYQSQWSADNEKKILRKDNRENDSHMSKEGSDDEEPGNNKWGLELDWLSKALEPALDFCKWAIPAGNGFGIKTPPVTRSVSEIIASIQRSRAGIQDWSLSDLTIGLYLIYLRQASINPFEDIQGVQISSEPIVQDLMYHTELAKGSYKDSAAGLARHSMLREGNILKFIRDSSVLRPGYYLGVDKRKKLVIFGIRGTHTVYDLITSIASLSNEEVTSEGYSAHFGIAEAAQWFLTHEMGNIRNCLEKHEGYRLRLVGHSLGGAIASLLAIMLRKKTCCELGFSPDIVSAVSYATPPCVSRETADSCADYVTTVVMQDDVVPRLSVAALTRLRNEIMQTDWTSVLDMENWKDVFDLVTNAKQVVSSVHHAGKKLASYAKLKSSTDFEGTKTRKELPTGAGMPSNSNKESNIMASKVDRTTPTPELFIPGTVYYLQRTPANNTDNLNHNKGLQYFTLWKRNPSNHFNRILLSSNIISDHKCDSHFFALRDVLKGLPGSPSGGVFDS